MSSGTSSLTLCVSVDLWPTPNLTHANFIHLHISFESKRKSILGTSTCSAQCQQILSAHLYLARKKGGSNDSQVIAFLWEVKSPSSCPRVGDSPKQHSYLDDKDNGGGKGEKAPSECTYHKHVHRYTLCVNRWEKGYIFYLPTGIWCLEDV